MPFIPRPVNKFCQESDRTSDPFFIITAGNNASNRAEVFSVEAF
jgi:hypothetical protein